MSTTPIPNISRRGFLGASAATGAVAVIGSLTLNTPSASAAYVPVTSYIPNVAKATKRVFLATNGSDNGDGSIDHPYATFAKAYSQLQPGAILEVRGGTYPKQLWELKGPWGSAAQPITIRSYPGERAVLDGGTRGGSLTGVTGDWNTWPEADTPGGLVIFNGVNYVNLLNISILGAPAGGITMAHGAGNLNIVDCHLDIIQDSGIRVAGNNINVINCTVRNSVMMNEARGNGGWGAGIHTVLDEYGQPARNIKFLNNTVEMCHGEAYVLTQVDGFLVQGCVAKDWFEIGYYCDSAANGTIEMSAAIRDQIGDVYNHATRPFSIGCEVLEKSTAAVKGSTNVTVRNNIFVDCLDACNMDLAAAQSYIHIQHNTFIRCGWAFGEPKGGDGTVENNLFESCTIGYNDGLKWETNNFHNCTFVNQPKGTVVTTDQSMTNASGRVWPSDFVVATSTAPRLDSVTNDFTGRTRPSGNVSFGALQA